MRLKQIFIKSRYSFLVMTKEEISKKGVMNTAIGYLKREVISENKLFFQSKGKQFCF